MQRSEQECMPEHYKLSSRVPSENKQKVTSVHTMKAYEELDVGFSHPINFGTRWRWKVSLTARSITPWKVLSVTTKYEAGENRYERRYVHKQKIKIIL